MTEKKTRTKGTVSILKTLTANIIDMIIVIVISIAILFIGDFLLRVTLGMFVADLIGMLLMLIIVVAVVYNAIMQSSKKSSTFGERVSRIYIKNREEN